MDKERFLASGLLEKYVLKLTTPEESQEVERYAQVFPEIRAEIEELQNALEHYAAHYANIPPAELKAKVAQKEMPEMKEATIKSTTGNGSRRLQWTAWLIAFATIAGLLWRQAQLKQAHRQLSEEFAALQQDCSQIRQAQDAAQRIIAFLRHDATQVIHLQGTSVSPEARVIVYWNEVAQSAYLRMVNMPPPPPGHQYQIWADVDGKMINAGLLNEIERDWQSINVVAHAESLNITIEPAGGSKHPTVSLLIANGKI